MIARTAVALVLLLGAACAARVAGEGLDSTALPADVRPDYALFARRCSKCHALGRALGSGIETDTQWVRYVERMRQQPASGISREDTPPILRFLHYYSFEQRRLRLERQQARSRDVSRHPHS